MLFRRKKGSILGLLVILLVLLTGCAKGTAHLTVQKNGSVDIALHLRLDPRAQSFISEKMEDSLISKLKAAGIELQKSQEGKFTEYQYVKSYTSEDLRSMVGSGSMDSDVSKSDFTESNVISTKKWFYTKYDLETQLKKNSYYDKIIANMETLPIPKSLSGLLLQSLAFDFKLTLPFNLYGDNNATEQNGRTLTWNINLSDPQPIHLVIYVPNIKNIAMAAAGGVLIVVVIIVYFIRKRKKFRKQ